MRGRLIFPFQLELQPLDVVAMREVDPVGPMAVGFDDDFREPAMLPPETGAGPGLLNRVESAALLIPAQIEPGEFEKIRQFMNGNSPTSQITACAHFRWFEDNDLVDSGGNVKVGIGDRLSRILDMDGNPMLTIRDPLYIVQAQPGGFGFGGKRNLLFMYFSDRGAGV